ncbi:uncharacterized protein B0H64DRAFT_397198 [Chaetomium fimeti]|uniref:Uncharacterized protein n=1 Tax=Chaetomium fimeti TaxID=1854472 RepID=A0AAE0HGI7_9PEZI|nr:hypothetical protein B0H64DRAFT_397198 [Chaetomium fimeti]
MWLASWVGVFLPSLSRALRLWSSRFWSLGSHKVLEDMGSEFDAVLLVGGSVTHCDIQLTTSACQRRSLHI